MAKYGNTGTTDETAKYDYKKIPMALDGAGVRVLLGNDQHVVGRIYAANSFGVMVDVMEPRARRVFYPWLNIAEVEVLQ